MENKNKKFCTRCGRLLKEGVNFCPLCGESVATKATKEAVCDNTSDSKKKIASENVQKNRGMAALAYILFLIPLFLGKESKFVQYHVYQGIRLIRCYFISIVIYFVVSFFVPFMGGILRPFMSVIAFFLLVLDIIGIIHALKGEMKPLPFFEFIEKFTEDD